MPIEKAEKNRLIFEKTKKNCSIKTVTLLVFRYVTGTITHVVGYVLLAILSAHTYIYPIAR